MSVVSSDPARKQSSDEPDRTSDDYRREWLLGRTIPLRNGTDGLNEPAADLGP